MLGSDKRSELKQSHHFFFLLPIMKTRRTHIPSSKKKSGIFRWSFRLYVRLYYLETKLKLFIIFRIPFLPPQINRTPHYQATHYPSPSAESCFTSCCFLSESTLSPHCLKLKGSLQRAQKEPNVPIPSQMNAIYSLPITF